MLYANVISAFAAEPWAMQREKLETIARFLAFKAGGGKLSAEEIKARIGDPGDRPASRTEGAIAVLSVHGVISQRMGLMQETSGGASTDAIGALFRAALADDRIKAIVLDVDSPGGSTYGIQDLADEIRAGRGVKPIVAQVNSVAASAAYWIAAQADEVVVTPGGVGGSIGVYAVHEDISEMLAKEGVKPTIVKAGENKAELNELGPPSDEALAALQSRVDSENAKFVRGVADGRKATVAAVNERMGQGRVFLAEDLVARGMADRIAPLRDTLARLGAAVPRPNSAAASRQSFAAGETPKLHLIEDVLREAGFPNALATAFVSRGKGALRSESGPTETLTLDPEARASFDRLLSKLGGQEI